MHGTLLFFELISSIVGSYICSDDNTMKKDCLDVAKFLVRTRCAMVANEPFNVKINNEVLKIKMVEESHGSMHFTMKIPDSCKASFVSSNSLNSSSILG